MAPHGGLGVRVSTRLLVPPASSISLAFTPPPPFGVSDSRDSMRMGRPGRFRVDRWVAFGSLYFWLGHHGSFRVGLFPARPPGPVPGRGGACALVLVELDQITGGVDPYVRRVTVDHLRARPAGGVSYGLGVISTTAAASWRAGRRQRMIGDVQGPGRRHEQYLPIEAHSRTVRPCGARSPLCGPECSA